MRGIKSPIKFFVVSALAVVFLMGLASAPAQALTAGAEYTVILYKFKSDGTLEEVSSTSVTADANGKIEFTLSDVPTNEEANFLVLSVEDADGNVVRQGFAPAPPAGSTSLTGINNLSTAQAQALIEAGELIGTDDPIPISFLLTFMRVADMTTGDVELIVALGRDAILGTGGFEDFLLDNGVSAAELEAFKAALVYNSVAGTVDLADYTAAFKTAIDTGSDEEMAKAGGFMADMFIDAAVAAGIKPGLIQAAHNAAGEVAANAANTARMAALSSSVAQAMNQSMNGFHMRLAAYTIKQNYTNALNTLNATGDQVTRFLAAVQTMMDTFATIETTYSDYWMDPDGYVADHGTTHEAVQAAMDAAWMAAFTAFMTGIQATDAEIAAMKQNVADALGITVAQLEADAPDLGTYRDFDDTVRNSPILEVVLTNWVADIIEAGGELTYTRDTLEVPLPQMQWLNNNTGTRTDFVGQGMPASFAALMGIREDLDIIEHHRYLAWENLGPDATQEEQMATERQARLTYEQRLAETAGRIGGTLDGTTPISTALKEAMLYLMVQPSMY